MYAVLLLLLACTPEPGATTATAAAAATTRVALRTVAPTPARHRPTVELTGSLEPVAAVQLGFDVPGRLVTLLVDRGSVVTRGQAIARLDTSVATSQLAQAQAGLAGAQAQLDGGEASSARAVKLREAGALAEQAFTDADAGIKQARAGVAQAEAAVQMAKTNLDKHTLRAPIGGVVTNGPDNAGLMIGAGTPLFVIEDLSSLQVKATAPESAAWLAAGQAATVLPGSPGATAGFPALVSRVIPSLDPATRRLPVEVRVTNPDPALRAHAFARVKIVAPVEVDAWSIPRNAIVARPDFCVFVTTGPSAVPTRIPVDILADAGENAVVQGRLSATDQLILDPPITMGQE